MAGEAEEVAGVVHELVHVRVRAEDGDDALVVAEEVVASPASSTVRLSQSAALATERSGTAIARVGDLTASVVRGDVMGFVLSPISRR